MTNLQQNAPLLSPTVLRRIWFGTPALLLTGGGVLIALGVLVPLWKTMQKDASRLQELQNLQAQVDLMRLQVNSLDQKQETLLAQRDRLFTLVAGSGDVSTLLATLDREARASGIRIESYDPQGAAAPPAAAAATPKPANGQAPPPAAPGNGLAAVGLQQSGMLITTKGTYLQQLAFLRRLEALNLLVIESNLKLDTGQATGDKNRPAAQLVTMNLGLSLYGKPLTAPIAGGRTPPARQARLHHSQNPHRINRLRTRRMAAEQTITLVPEDETRYHARDLTRGHVGKGKGRRGLHALIPLAAVVLPVLATVVQAQSVPGSGGNPAAAASSGPPEALSPPISGSVEMKLRRLPGSVELVIEGTGAAPQLQQSASGYVWKGLLLTSQTNGLRLGPQRLALPEAGFESFSLEGSGRVYRIAVTPMPGMAVPRPVVSADGRSLVLSFNAPSRPQSQTRTPSLNTPGMVDQPAVLPALQPRAEAPPVGDIAVGTMMLANPSYLDLGNSPLKSIAWNGPISAFFSYILNNTNYGITYVNDTPAAGSQSSTTTGAATSSISPANRQVALSLKHPTLSQAFNAALLAAGLQAKKQGNMILVGPNVLGITFGASMSKVFRLNQVSASAAADYLANLGATITKVNTITTSVTEGANQTNAIAGSTNSATTQSSRQTVVENYAAAQGPLKGLLGTTDSRLGTISLVGDPRMIAIAESYLRQLDLRQRQVALSVKILDVTLDNDSAVANSFAFRYGNNFIVNASGQLLGAFNNQLPPSSADQFNTLSGGASNAKPIYIDNTQGTDTRNPLFPAPVNPGNAYAQNNFYNYVQAQIQAQTTKVLASPTLILSDNPESISGGNTNIQAFTPGSGSSTATGLIGRSKANEAFITIGDQIITSYTVQAGINNAPATCQPVLQVAGLTFGARVSKIDDNGFVTFSISPSITAAVRQQNIPQCGPINILAIRSLDSGNARVRDGQTLILTGVISDRDTQAVTKWPLLGDLPLLGQFFRASTSTRSKRELVIMVTPRIVRDDEIGAYSTGYQPGTTQGRDLLRMSAGSPSP
jgi:type IV pilus assembly protein PilQ